jgi:preprotein translocase subunit SecA
MSASGRKKDGGKKRKKTLRTMLTVGTIVKAHAERYRRLLEQQWQTKTDFSKAEAGQVIKRLDDVLALLPAAMEQARKRIFGGPMPMVHVGWVLDYSFCMELAS